MKKIIAALLGVMLVILMASCTGTEMTRSSVTPEEAVSSTIIEKAGESMNEAANAEAISPVSSEAMSAPELFYFGQASMCIVTEDSHVIYIDPYADGDYSRPADLILVTHGHYDHNAVDLIEKRNDDCTIITQNEAIENDEHKTFQFSFVTVEAVEAGFNQYHDVSECVGYILTFNNGKSVYVTGDTSTTDQMSELSEKNIDYAFYCCDGVFNMGLDEAAKCAELVGAKHNIPYHNSTENSGEMFDRELAEQFDAPNKMIVYPGESIMIE